MNLLSPTLLLKPPSQGEPQCLGAQGKPSTSTFPLQEGKIAVLVISPKLEGRVFADAVAVSWSGSSEDEADTEHSVFYAAGSTLTWRVDEDSQYVSVINADGVNNCLAWVYSFDPG